MGLEQNCREGIFIQRSSSGRREKQRWGQNKVETLTRILSICWWGATREHPQWASWKHIAFPDVALEFTGIISAIVIILPRFKVGVAMDSHRLMEGYGDPVFRTHTRVGSYTC